MKTNEIKMMMSLKIKLVVPNVNSKNGELNVGK